MIRHLAPLALFALLSPPSLCSQELFVDAVRGEDHNPGSAELPLKSITAALAVATPSTRVFVLPGRYSGPRTGEVFPLGFGTTRDHTGVVLFGIDNVVLELAEVAGTAISVGDLASGGRITNFRFEAMSGLAVENRVISADALSAPQSARGFELDRCVFRSCGRGVVFPGGVPTRGWRIHNNLFVDVGVVGIEEGDPGSAHEFYNNTFVRGAGVGIDSVSESTRMLNNLLTELEVGIASDAAPTTVAGRIRANDFWDNRRSVEGQAFVGGFPQENFRLDPEFRDAAAGDFQLAFRSALIELGDPDVFTRADLDASPGVVDFDGDGQLLPDIGAYEATPVALTLDYQRNVLSFHLSASSTLYWLRIGVVLVALDDGLVRLPGVSPILLDPTPFGAFPAFVGTMPVGFRTVLPTPPPGTRLVLQGFGYEPSLDLLVGGPQRRLQF